MEERAIAQFRRAVELSQREPRSLGLLGYAYGVSEQTSKALSVLDELSALSDQRYVEPIAFARVYVGLDDKEKAFDWLDRALRERSSELCHLGAWPMYRTLRSDPRFGALLKQLGLE